MLNQHPQLLYEKVAQMVVDSIESGALLSGDKLPSLRVMSKQLKVSIATVMQAYINLEDKGLIETRPQSGYYVRENPRTLLPVPNKKSPRSTPKKVKIQSTVDAFFANAHKPGVIPLGISNPSLDLLPQKALTRTTRELVSRRSDAAVNYSPLQGRLELRRQIALRSADLGSIITPDNIIITNGAIESLRVALQAVTKPGDIVAVESPTYFLLLQIIQRMGMLAVEIETDPTTGMDMASLQRTLENFDIAAVVTVCNFNNPLGSLMPIERKREMVRILARKKIPLIEDDIYGDIYFGPNRPPTCKSFDDAGLVITCSSFSKTIAPGYRIGWITATKHIDKMLKAKLLNSSSNASLPQMVMGEFLRVGHFDRLLTKTRRAYRDRVDQYRMAIAEFFPATTRVTRPQGGFSLWVQLPKGVHSADLCDKAFDDNISVTPGVLFSTTEKYKNYIRICASPIWGKEVEHAVNTLGNITSELAQ